jgi:hypothetical protein
VPRINDIPPKDAISPMARPSALPIPVSELNGDPAVGALVDEPVNAAAKA